MLEIICGGLLIMAIAGTCWSLLKQSIRMFRGEDF